MRKSNYEIAKEYAETTVKERLHKDMWNTVYFQLDYDRVLYEKIKELEDRKYTLKEMKDAFDSGREFQRDMNTPNEMSFEEFIKILN